MSVCIDFKYMSIGHSWDWSQVDGFIKEDPYLTMQDEMIAKVRSNDIIAVNGLEHRATCRCIPMTYTRLASMHLGSDVSAIITKKVLVNEHLALRCNMLFHVQRELMRRDSMVIYKILMRNHGLCLEVTSISPFSDWLDVRMMLPVDPRIRHPQYLSESKKLELINFATMLFGLRCLRKGCNRALHRPVDSWFQIILKVKANVHKESFV
jgi:hypothetical protein